MACLYPVTMYRPKADKGMQGYGKGPLVSASKGSHSGVPMRIACGRCIECRLQHAAGWATRCMHETKSHEVNTFVTLTYDDKNLPEDGSLFYRDFQLFMKRLRKKSDFQFKFYMCGEYGERTLRPHYHALLFGMDFSDRRFYKYGSDGDRLDTSQLLDDTWEKGLCSVGDVTLQSAGYVSGYVTQKVTGDKAADHYMGRLPEFSHMSNGIGKAWIAKYGKQVYDLDRIIVDGKKVKTPRYYDEFYKLVDLSAVERVKKLRRKDAHAKEIELKDRVEQNGLFNTFIARDAVRRARLHRRDVR